MTRAAQWIAAAEFSLFLDHVEEQAERAAFDLERSDWDFQSDWRRGFSPAQSVRRAKRAR